MDKWPNSGRWDRIYRIEKKQWKPWEYRHASAICISRNPMRYKSACIYSLVDRKRYSCRCRNRALQKAVG
nr:MAG TPA: hypothetical protein [Caudoviricetes sp.]